MSLGHGTSIVRNGLVLYLDAANKKSYSGTGTTWTDLSGNGRNGTLTNTPTYSSLNNGSIVFDGTNEYVDISGSTTLTEATFSVWLKRNGDQIGFAGILSNRSTSVTGLNFYSTTNKIGYHWNGTTSSYLFDSGLTIPDGAWCMAVVTVTSTTATLYLCQSAGITTATNTVEHTSTTLDSVKLAWDAIGPTNRFMNGSIAQASLYNRALTAAEIQQNFEAIRGRYGI